MKGCRNGLSIKYSVALWGTVADIFFTVCITYRDEGERDKQQTPSNYTPEIIPGSRWNTVLQPGVPKAPTILHNTIRHTQTLTRTKTFAQILPERHSDISSKTFKYLYAHRGSAKDRGSSIVTNAFPWEPGGGGGDEGMIFNGGSVQARGKDARIWLGNEWARLRQLAT